MLKVRSSVFETNSSSTHSVSIESGDNNMYDTIVPDDDGKIVVECMSFGWEWEAYYDAETKLSYAVAFARENQIWLDSIIEAVKEHTGAKEVVFEVPKEYYYAIDHQSAASEGGAGCDIFDTKQSIKDFIFNPKSYVRTGNDNSEAPPNFYDDPSTVYTHELQLISKDGGIFSYKLDKELSEEEKKEMVTDLVDKHYYPLSIQEDFRFNSFRDLNKDIVYLVKTGHPKNLLDIDGSFSNSIITKKSEIQVKIRKL